MTAKKGKNNMIGKRGVAPVDRVIGNHLKALRLERELSQEEVADHCGLSFQQIQKYEKGTNRLAMARALQIASLFKVEVGDLLGKPNGGGIDMISALDTESYKLALTFRLLPHDLKIKVRALIHAIVDIK